MPKGKTIGSHSKSTARWRPYPWSRYSPDDLPRAKPLPRCPSAKCRRAKACLDAHKGLFCRRTHFSQAEGQIRAEKTEMEKYLLSLPRPPAGAPLEIRLEFIREAQDLRLAEAKERMKLWRAGAYGKAYGPYRTGGVMKQPPDKTFREE